MREEEELVAGRRAASGCGAVGRGGDASARGRGRAGREERGKSWRHEDGGGTCQPCGAGGGGLQIPSGGSSRSRRGERAHLSPSPWRHAHLTPDPDCCLGRFPDVRVILLQAC